MILQEKYDASIATSSFVKGDVPQAIADLYGYVTFANRIPTPVNKGLVVYKNEEGCGSQRITE